MRVLYAVFAVAVVVLLAVALGFAFAVLPGMDAEVAPVACEVFDAECPQINAGETEVPVVMDDANRCVETASLTVSPVEKSGALHNGMFKHSLGNMARPVLKLPRSGVDVIGDLGATFTNGRYSGAGA